MPHRSVAFALLAASLSGAACTFPDPEIRNPAHSTPDAEADHVSETGPSDAAAPDAGHDGDHDAGCTPPAHCYAQAGKCSGACVTTEGACANQVGCPLEPNCVANCEDAEASCRTECAATCTLCTADAGCLDVSGCTTATN